MNRLFLAIAILTGLRPAWLRALDQAYGRMDLRTALAVARYRRLLENFEQQRRLKEIARASLASQKGRISP